MEQSDLEDLSSLPEESSPYKTLLMILGEKELKENWSQAGNYFHQTDFAQLWTIRTTPACSRPGRKSQLDIKLKTFTLCSVSLLLYVQFAADAGNKAESIVKWFDDRKINPEFSDDLKNDLFYDCGAILLDRMKLNYLRARVIVEREELIKFERKLKFLSSPGDKIWQYVIEIRKLLKPWKTEVIEEFAKIKEEEHGHIISFLIDQEEKTKLQTIDEMRSNVSVLYALMHGFNYRSNELVKRRIKKYLRPNLLFTDEGRELIVFARNRIGELSECKKNTHLRKMPTNKKIAAELLSQLLFGFGINLNSEYWRKNVR